MLDKTICLYVFIFLYGGLIISLFVRALIRKQLIKKYENLNKDGFSKKDQNIISTGIFALTRNLQITKKLKATINKAPIGLQKKYQYFQFLSVTSIILLALVLVFAFWAYKIC